MGFLLKTYSWRDTATSKPGLSERWVGVKLKNVELPRLHECKAGTSSWAEDVGLVISEVSLDARSPSAPNGEKMRLLSTYD